MMRPWLKVREKILSMAVDLHLLDKVPEHKNDLSLGETAEEVIKTLSQLQENARSTTDAVLALQQSQADLLDSLPDPLLLLNANLQIERANSAAREFFGRNLLGKDLSSILRPPQLLEACQHAMQTGLEQTVDFKLATPVERIFQARLKPLHHRGFQQSNEEATILLALNDITAIKRSEQMRADFVANVSHEMRTPLASLIGFIETLQGPASKDPNAQKSFLKIMDTQAKNMSRLVEDLLSLSRIEMREHLPPQDPVDIEPLLTSIALALQMQLAAKNMKIEIKCDEDLPPVRGDGDELYQLLQNLITNAIRYGRPETPVQITAAYRLKAPDEFQNREADAVEIRVHDYGIGIAAEHIPRLTERFYRVDPARAREVGGTGPARVSEIGRWGV
jgi:two-component system phosphate regulon sensor histidine kinase PhoR